MFDNFTDVDRQTELNDDDGSLTGLSHPKRYVHTISVNLDPFFSAPVETVECVSGPFIDDTVTPVLPPGTAKTSPYDYVTTAIYPKCMASMPGDDQCNKLIQDSDPPKVDPKTIWNYRMLDRDLLWRPAIQAGFDSTRRRTDLLCRLRYRHPVSD